MGCGCGGSSSGASSVKGRWFGGQGSAGKAVPAGAEARAWPRGCIDCDPVALTTSAQSLFVERPLTKFKVTSITVCNTSGAQRAVSLHKTKHGAAVAVGNALWYLEPFPAGMTIDKVKRTIELDHDYQALADATGVTVTIEGYETL